MKAGSRAPLDDLEFDELYRRHYPAVLKTIRIMLLNPVLAEDLAQETFLRAYRFRGRYDRSRPPGPWLQTIAANLVRSQMRRNKLLSILSLSGFRSEPVSEPAQWGVDTSLMTALAGLPRAERTALVLHHVHGYDYAEVASILGIPTGTVGSQLNRARTRLRLALKDPGAGAGDGVPLHGSPPSPTGGDRA